MRWNTGIWKSKSNYLLFNDLTTLTLTVTMSTIHTTKSTQRVGEIEFNLDIFPRDREPSWTPPPPSIRGSAKVKKSSAAWRPSANNTPVNAPPSPPDENDEFTPSATGQYHDLGPDALRNVLRPPSKICESIKEAHRQPRALSPVIMKDDSPPPMVRSASYQSPFRPPTPETDEAGQASPTTPSSTATPPRIDSIDSMREATPPPEPVGGLSPPRGPSPAEQHNEELRATPLYNALRNPQEPEPEPEQVQEPQTSDYPSPPLTQDQLLPRALSPEELRLLAAQLEATAIAPSRRAGHHPPRCGRVQPQLEQHTNALISDALHSNPVPHPTGFTPERMPPVDEFAPTQSSEMSALHHSATAPARPMHRRRSRSVGWVPQHPPGPSPITNANNTNSSPAVLKVPKHEKHGWLSHLGHKTTESINHLAHKFGGTSFLPEPLENECDKACHILRTFCKKGIYAEPSKVPSQRAASPDSQTSTSSQGSPKWLKSLVHIPPKVISKAVGLAIFTTFRAGLSFRGATGSGILIARQHDGSWSPPSAVQLHSFGGGLVAGLDVYDCVCVINTQDALSAFMDGRVTMGGDVAVVAGPWGAGGAVEWSSQKDKEHGRESPREGSPIPTLEVNGEPVKINKETKAPGPRHRRGDHSKLHPVLSYANSRGFYAGFGYDGTLMTERKEANAAFYGESVTGEQILRGLVPAPQGHPSLEKLFEVLRASEGGGIGTDSDVSITGPPAEDFMSPPPPMPPSCPADSLHPMAAFVPERKALWS